MSESRGPATDQPPPILAVDADQIGNGVLPICKRSWWNLVNSGRAPAGFKLGGRRLWDVAELKRWVAADCPRRDESKRIERERNQ